MSAQGKVYGVDFSEASVAASKRTNARDIEMGRVEIRHASVSELPFPDGMFDLITAVETHFWWPDLPGDMREVFRVVKPGGTFLVIAEVYKGANTTMARLCEKCAPQTGMNLRALKSIANFSPTPASRKFKSLRSPPKDGSAESVESPEPRGPSGEQIGPRYASVSRFAVFARHFLGWEMLSGEAAM